MFLKLLKDNVKHGVINLHMPGGQNYRFGNNGLETHWNIKSEKVIQTIAKDWEF